VRKYDAEPTVPLEDFEDLLYRLFKQLEVLLLGLLEVTCLDYLQGSFLVSHLHP